MSGYIDNVWNGVRQIIIFEGLMAKYSQNPELGEKLKATGNAILAEAAVNDRIWGIGLSMKDPNQNNGMDKILWGMQQCWYEKEFNFLGNFCRNLQKVPFLIISN